MLHRSINCTMYALSPARRPGTYLLPCLPCCCGIFLRRWASCAPQLAIIQCTSSNESGMASFGGKHPMQRACPPPLPRQLVFFRILHRQGVQFCEGNCITHIQWFSARPSAAQLLRSSRLPFGGLDESLKATGNGFWRPNRRRFPWQRFRHPDRAPKRKQNVHQRNTQEVPGPQDRCLVCGRWLMVSAPSRDHAARNVAQRHNLATMQSTPCSWRPVALVFPANAVLDRMSPCS